jgi:hypothetical protein
VGGVLGSVAQDAVSTSYSARTSTDPVRRKGVWRKTIVGPRFGRRLTLNSEGTRGTSAWQPSEPVET